MRAWDNKTIDGYVAKWGEDPTTRSLVETAPLASGESVLDIGCGSGASLRHAKKLGAGRAVGVDLPRMIQHAVGASLGFQIEYFAGCAEELPVGDCQFDGVFAVNSIHHWGDRATGLEEVKRVLKSGGWFVMGGEIFDETILPEGQDYRKELLRHGFVDPRRSVYDRFFTTIARRK